MSRKEASARLKINKLLEDAGWRLFDEAGERANVQVENHVHLNSLGDDFEHVPNGFIDYLLLDNNQKPIAVLEAKRESIGTLTASLVHPREVFADAITDRAASIIVAHNHPSGSLEASIADHEVTGRLTEVSKLLGVNLNDHIIVTSTGFVSIL